MNTLLHPNHQLTRKCCAFFFCFLLSAFCFLPGSGCKTHQLEAGGAYAPVTSTNADGLVTATLGEGALFAADTAFALANTAMDTAFELERKNRALIWKLSPDVKHTLDAIRPKAVDARRRYAIARQAYLASPQASNLSALQNVLDEISTLSSAATAAITAAAADASASATATATGK